MKKGPKYTCKTIIPYTVAVLMPNFNQELEYSNCYAQIKTLFPN